MSPEERAYAVCKAMEPRMVAMTGGAVATAHYDAGLELIAAAIREAVLEEREACAALCKREEQNCSGSCHRLDAALIRARKEPSA